MPLSLRALDLQPKPGGGLVESNVQACECGGAADEVGVLVLLCLWGCALGIWFV